MNKFLIEGIDKLIKETDDFIASSDVFFSRVVIPAKINENKPAKNKRSNKYDGMSLQERRKLQKREYEERNKNNHDYIARKKASWKKHSEKRKLLRKKLKEQQNK